MQRVLVLGPPGSGKSTFARQLGDRVGLPVIHLDQLFWNPGWVQAPKDTYLQRLDAALAGERWIIDGNNASTLDRRLPRADAVVLFERSRLACLWRVLRRVIGSYGRVRADMAADCPERFDLEFMKFIWSFPKTQTPKVLAALSRHDAWSRTTILESDREADAFLARVAPARA